MSYFWVAAISGGIGIVVGAVGLALLIFYGLGKVAKNGEKQDLDQGV